MAPIIKVEHLNKSFPTPDGNRVTVLKDISLEIPGQSLIILKGRSGSGKTTLINLLGALDRPDSGSIWCMDEDIAAASEKRRETIRRTKFGFVFQTVSLIPVLTAAENVEFALRLAGTHKKQSARVEKCLKMVGLGNRIHHMPQEMSGGEQQRVAIARAAVNNPLVLLADEPTAELDSVTAVSVVKLFREMVKQEGMTIIMTTHDTALMEAADKVIELEDGRLV